MPEDGKNMPGVPAVEGIPMAVVAIPSPGTWPIVLGESLRRRPREKQPEWERYSKVLQRHFSHFEALFSPDLFIMGGGIPACADEYS